MFCKYRTVGITAHAAINFFNTHAILIITAFSSLFSTRWVLWAPHLRTHFRRSWLIAFVQLFFGQSFDCLLWSDGCSGTNHDIYGLSNEIMPPYRQPSHYQYLTHWGQDKMAAILPDNIFKCIFLNENVWISIKISLKVVPKGLINNIPALVQIMHNIPNCMKEVTWLMLCLSTNGHRSVGLGWLPFI